MPCIVKKSIRASVEKPWPRRLPITLDIQRSIGCFAIANCARPSWTASALNVWTQTELVGGTWDETAGCWDVQLKRGDGTERCMRPRHIVFANGVSTTPILPHLLGLNEFHGAVRHSGDYGSGLDWQGKRALVLGTGTSKHDVAQDLCVSGAAEVTLIQRSPTLVVSLKEAQAPYALYDEDVLFGDLDLLAIASPFPVYRRSHQHITAMNREADHELLEGLVRCGFRLTFGPDGWPARSGRHASRCRPSSPRPPARTARYRRTGSARHGRR
jgi:Flavin-binding monooxygenase-like